MFLRHGLARPVLAALVGLGAGVVCLPSAQASAGVPAPAAGGVSVTYACTSAIGSLKLVVKASGVTPASVPVDTGVKMSAAQLRLTVPAVYVNKVISFTNAKSASGKSTKLDISSTNADVATVNAAATPIAFGPIPLIKNKSAVLALPAKPATFGSWVASDSHGSVMTFSAGEVVVSMKIGHFSGVATCKPTSTVALSTTKVA